MYIVYTFYDRNRIARKLEKKFGFPTSVTDVIDIFKIILTIPIILKLL